MDGRGGVAKGGEIQHEGKRAAWSLGATRGRPRQAGGGRGPPRRRAAALSAGGAEAEEQGGRR